MTNDKCITCGTELIFTKTPKSKHYGRLDCLKCCKWIKFVPDPEKIMQRKETTMHKIDTTRCRLCGRFAIELGIRETIEIDHLLPLEDGGKDEIDNILAECTSCHKLRHWLWLYVGKHMRLKNQLIGD